MRIWFMLLATVLGCHQSPALRQDGGHTSHRMGGSTPVRFNYLSGSSGTATVPAANYVTSISAHCTSNDGGACTMQIVPAGPELAAVDAAAYPLVSIPPGLSYTLEMPTIRGNPNELGDGTQFIFVGTDAYTVTTMVY